MTVPVRLRGHHLLCLMTYVGKGYSPGFVAGMDEVVSRLNAGVPAEIISGPDDICATHCAERRDPHCLKADARWRDETALSDIGQLTGMTLKPGSILLLDPTRLAEFRTAFAAGTTRRACAGCPWTDFCDEIAAGGFSGTRLGPSAG